MDKIEFQEIRKIRLFLSQLRFHKKLNKDQLKRFNKNKKYFTRMLLPGQIAEIRALYEEVVKDRKIARDLRYPKPLKETWPKDDFFSWDEANDPKID